MAKPRVHGRNAYLVTYDVTDKRRLRQVHRLMKGYGDALQYSVFRCELSSKERELLVTDLVEAIQPKSDRVMIVDLGPASSPRHRIRFLGTPLAPLQEDGPVVF